MDVIFKDYSRGACIKLVAKDVPTTTLRKMTDLFVQALDEVSEKQNAEPKVQLRWGGSAELQTLVENTTHAVNGGVMFNLARAQEEANAALAAEEAPAKKRGRPKKDAATSPAVVEMQVEVKENVEAMAEQMHGAPASEAPLSEPASADTSGAGEKSEDSTDGTGISGSTTSTSSTAMTAASPSDLAVDDEEPPTGFPLARQAEITDTELQRYCAKVAQHFGSPKPVMDLAAPFVPDGAVVRPSNIRDNAARWDFIKAAEEASGVRYHG